MVNTYPLLRNFNKTLYLTELIVLPELVKEIQAVLKEGGFFLGAIDGYLNIETVGAFKKFKQSAYLEYPDVLGESTVDALLELAGQSAHPTPKEATKVVAASSKGKSIRLAGQITVYCDQPIAGCGHFTWGEATKNGERLPSDKAIVDRIVATAHYLELIRELFGGRTIFITSWYRPPDVNRQQGGVKNSRHLLGDAVDFLVEDIPPLEVYRRLNNWHGARGGLGNSRAFTHLDRRGYCARFSYG